MSAGIQARKWGGGGRSAGGAGGPGGGCARGCGGNGGGDGGAGGRIGLDKSRQRREVTEAEALVPPDDVRDESSVRLFLMTPYDCAIEK